MNYEDFEEELCRVKLTKSQFSELSNTPLSTVAGWKAARRKNKAVPGWVQPFLALHKEAYELRVALKVLNRFSRES
jgi:hypothetical protein